MTTPPGTVQQAERLLASSPELRRQARALFFAGVYVTEIMDHLRLSSQQELQRYVTGEDGTGQDPDCWLYQRSIRPRSSAVVYERVKPMLLRATEFKLLNRIIDSVDELEQKGTRLSISDMEKAVGMMERLDKITRLEEGKATEHIASSRTTYSLRDIARMREEKSNGQQPTTVEGEVVDRAPAARIPTGDPGEA